MYERAKMPCGQRDRSSRSSASSSDRLIFVRSAIVVREICCSSRRDLRRAPKVEVMANDRRDALKTSNTPEMPQASTVGGVDQRDCFTENVWPAIVAVPFRLRGRPVYGPTEYVTVPLPLDRKSKRLNS